MMLLLMIMLIWDDVVVVAIACLSNVDASNVRDEVVCLAGEGEDN